MIEISNRMAKILLDKIPRVARMIGPKDSIKAQNDARILMMEISKLRKKIK